MNILLFVLFTLPHSYIHWFTCCLLIILIYLRCGGTGGHTSISVHIVVWWVWVVTLDSVCTPVSTMSAIMSSTYSDVAYTSIFLTASIVTVTVVTDVIYWLDDLYLVTYLSASLFWPPIILFLIWVVFPSITVSALPLPSLSNHIVSWASVIHEADIVLPDISPDGCVGHCTYLIELSLWVKTNACSLSIQSHGSHVALLKHWV